MRQRGRKSRFTHAAPTAAPARPVAAPEGFPEDAAAIWRRVVVALPGGWFGPEHRDMLSAYCLHAAAANRFQLELAGMDADTSCPDSIMAANRLSGMAERESRAALAMARSMRITHQAQTTPTEAARSKGGVDWTGVPRNAG